MSANLGPLFCLKAEAPAEWNLAGLHDEDYWVTLREGDRAYVLEIFSASFREKLKAGGTHHVFIAQVIREDAEVLFGFETVLERALFIELRNMDSIGPKTAAQILGGLGPERIPLLVQGKLPAGMKISGVGPKTFDRLEAGLRSRKERLLELSRFCGAAGEGAVPRLSTASGQEIPLLLFQGLSKLGLRREEVALACEGLSAEGVDVSQLAPAEGIRRVLQFWGRGKGGLTTRDAHG